MTQTVFVGAGETAEAAVITSNGGFKAAGKGRSFRSIGNFEETFLQSVDLNLVQTEKLKSPSLPHIYQSYADRYRY